MRFLPVVDLWNPAINEAVSRGQMKLQKGQWVRCGSDKLSRWVGLSHGGSLWAVHPDGNGGVSRARFSEACKSWSVV